MVKYKKKTIFYLNSIFFICFFVICVHFSRRSFYVVSCGSTHIWANILWLLNSWFLYTCGWLTWKTWKRYLCRLVSDSAMIAASLCNNNPVFPRFYSLLTWLSFKRTLSYVILKGSMRQIYAGREQWSSVVFILVFYFVTYLLAALM